MKKTILALPVILIALMATVCTSCEKEDNMGISKTLVGTEWEGSISYEDYKLTQRLIFLDDEFAKVDFKIYDLDNKLEKEGSLPATYTYDGSTKSGTITLNNDKGTFRCTEEFMIIMIDEDDSVMFKRVK